VPTLHALDALNFMLGEFASIGAHLEIGRKSVRVLGEPAIIPVTAPDQVAIIGRLQSGATASVFYRGGASRSNGFHWEINGTEGDLVINSPDGNVQVAELKLKGGTGADAQVKDIALSEDAEIIVNVPGGPAGNVARLYAQFAKDVQEGTHIAPDFARALARHQLLEAISLASETKSFQPIEQLAMT